MKTLCLGCMETYEGDFDVCPYCGYVQSSPAKELFHITPGSVLRKRYKVGTALGAGGFGITYKGYDLVLEKKVAIKEYFPVEFATRTLNQTKLTVYTGEKQEQFLAGMKKSLDEARRLAEFQQTAGITQIFDFFEENNTAYIVMELLEGETLKEKLKRDGKIPVEEALPIVLKVLGALKEVHAKKIIHRDIAPDNIFLLKDGGVKLMDFGASRQATGTHSKSLTVILKVGYAPVEQYQSNGNQGPWTDIYALAATFYKMITGVRPPEAPDRRLKDTLKEPSKMGVTIDKNIENALMNALHVRMEDRIKSAEEFEEALRSSDVKRTTPTVEKADMGKWPLWMKAGCGVATALVIGAGVLIATGVIDTPLPTLPGFSQSEGSVWMPSLVNLSQDMAKQRLEESGLKFAVGATEASDTILKGYVLGQTDENGNKIAPGDEVKQGQTIYVTISSGNGMAVIPDILWMNQESAEQMLNESELIAINTETDVESWAPAGVVTAVEPEQGTEVKLEDVITLKISAGNSIAESGEVSVPDLSGMDQTTAYDTLKTEGLFVQKEGLENSVTVPAGTVIRQEPEAGSVQSKGDTVRIVVSSGPRKIQLTSVVGQAEANARTELEALGLVVNVAYEYSDSVERGVVISQSIEPGTVDEGMGITITVSQGAKPAETTQSNRNINRTNTNTQNNRNTNNGNSNNNVSAPTQQTAQPTQAPTSAPVQETAPPATQEQKSNPWNW
ncbi:PASTA domain-containing protein [Brotaphodocola sp.]|uniref:PASTA domain-containing protein n=1 Tax=Brotaphodocola sp. TaxID=3073577 RepID=UPI003D7E7A76